MSAAGGGGVGNAGTPTLQTLPYDKKTKPITRRDLIEFLKDEKNTTEYEKQILLKGMYYGVSGILIAGYLGWWASGKVPWRFLKKQGLPVQGFITYCRIAMTCCAISIPYVVVQQWMIQQVLSLDHESLLGFNVKRFMVTQRSGLLFHRRATREVTKQEQEEFMRMAEQQRKGVTYKSGFQPGTDVNLALGQQAMQPLAQTGYK